MRHVVHFVKHWLVPGSMPMLFVSLVAGAVLLNAGYASDLIGRAWITAVAAIYWALSLPAVSSWLLERTEPKSDRLSQPPPGGASVMVVFGNGSVHYTDGTYTVDYLTRRSVFCGFQAARLYALASPDVVIATGGKAGPETAPPECELLASLLVSCGVPSERIIQEARSRTTAEQVSNVVKMIREIGTHGGVLAVTTSAHMPRVVGLFTQHGIVVIPSTTPELRYDCGITGWRRWWPSMSALTGSSSVMYELLAGARAAAFGEKTT